MFSQKATEKLEKKSPQSVSVSEELENESSQEASESEEFESESPQSASESEKLEKKPSQKFFESGKLEKKPLQDVSKNEMINLAARALENCITRERMKRAIAFKDGAKNPKYSNTLFDAKEIPQTSIKDYLTRLVNGCMVEEFQRDYKEVLIASAIYINRYLNASDRPLSMYNVHRVLLASFVLAIKFLSDEYYEKGYLAKVAGVSVSELNKLELEFFIIVQFHLFIDGETYDEYVKHFEKLQKGLAAEVEPKEKEKSSDQVRMSLG